MPSDRRKNPPVWRSRAEKRPNPYPVLMPSPADHSPTGGIHYSILTRTVGGILSIPLTHVLGLSPVSRGSRPCDLPGALPPLIYPILGQWAPLFIPPIPIWIIKCLYRPGSSQMFFLLAPIPLIDRHSQTGQLRYIIPGECHIVLIEHLQGTPHRLL